jgi:hypothetical protein
MPAKDKIKITFWLTPAEDKALKDALTLPNGKRRNQSDYIRGLIAADLPDFPADMPGQGKEGASNRGKK